MGPGLVYPQGSCVSCLLSHFVRGNSFTSFSALLIINYLFILFLFIQQVVSGYIFLKLGTVWLVDHSLMKKTDILLVFMELTFPQ